MEALISVFCVNFCCYNLLLNSKLQIQVVVIEKILDFLEIILDNN